VENADNHARQELLDELEDDEQDDDDADDRMDDDIVKGKASVIRK